MPLFDHPHSFRLRELAAAAAGASVHRKRDLTSDQSTFTMAAANSTIALAANATLGLLDDTRIGHGSHPNFVHLAGLVCEAVLEVIFVALPGFLVAYTGMFDAHSQKFVAELNTMVFTPCLVFTKLASQLNADKLADLVVIPFIFAAQTMVSYLCAQAMARVFGFAGREKKRQRNFILAMGVFGNSNSLPISLVLSLSKTISGLHWDKVPGDNDDEVAARGILYLLIFQQLGQLLRWTWGYSVLLKPASAYEEEERREEAEQHRFVEEGEYRDDPDDVVPVDGNGTKLHKTPDSGFSSGSQSPRNGGIRSDDDDDDVPEIVPSTAANGNNISTEPRHLPHAQPQRPTNGLDDRSRSLGHMTTFPNYSPASSGAKYNSSTGEGWKKPFYLVRNHAIRFLYQVTSTITTFLTNLFRRLPTPVQKTLSTLQHYNARFWAGVWRQMNPPLWAMLFALIVASIPKLQHVFFTPGTLVNNSVTRAVSQSGGVAVPLILVVLGANLARSTLPQDQLATTPEEKKEERRLLYASLLSRMVLPTLLMAPVLALMAKYVPVSILDDPIFVIVCFLLTGAPSALQLAQICQVNGVFMGAMSSLLTASYVGAIFPSTLCLVMLALEVLEWAQA
jgi:auxin efflux carrier family protein